MKRFVKFDYYLQTFILIGTSIFSIICLCWGTKGYAFLFYPVVGLIQLLSYLARIFMPYKKSVDYILYGVLVLPIWPNLFASIDPHFVPAMPIGLYLVCALVFSPFLALLYVCDCRRTYMKLTFRIQKYLHLVN